MSMPRLLYQHYVDITTTHHAHGQRGQMYSRTAALGRLNKGDISKADVERPVGDTSQDDSLIPVLDDNAA
jgi:hypothetical protein